MNKNAAESIKDTVDANNCSLVDTSINTKPNNALTPRITPTVIGMVGASPALRSAKRALRLSPSTPVGLSRILQLCEQGQEVKQINFGDDVERIDLDPRNESPKPQFSHDEIELKMTADAWSRI